MSGRSISCMAIRLGSFPVKNSVTPRPFAISSSWLINSLLCDFLFKVDALQMNVIPYLQLPRCLIWWVFSRFSPDAQLPLQIAAIRFGTAVGPALYYIIQTWHNIPGRHLSTIFIAAKAHQLWRYNNRLVCGWGKAAFYRACWWSWTTSQMMAGFVTMGVHVILVQSKSGERGAG